MSPEAAAIVEHIRNKARVARKNGMNETSNVLDQLIRDIEQGLVGSADASPTEGTDIA